MGAASPETRAAITDVRAKGRVLLGEAQFAPMAAAERAVQKELETRGRVSWRRSRTPSSAASMRRNTSTDGKSAEVVSARALQPTDVGRMEERLTELAARKRRQRSDPSR
jgi:hypothetical protein